MGSRVVVAIGLFVGATCACGLSVVGIAPLDIGGSGSDGGPSADGEVPSVDASSVVCEGADPSIDAVVIAGAHDACPSGTRESAVYMDPKAAADACSCGSCTPEKDPTCSTPSLSFDHGTTNSCSAGNRIHSNVVDGTCRDFGAGGAVTIDGFHEWGALTPVAGTCTAKSVADETKVTTTTLKQCQPATAAAACDALRAGARVCIDMGAGSCGGGYPVALTVGDGASVTCGACACVRGATKCVVDYYGNSTCTDSVKYTHELSGMCTATNGASGVAFFKVHAAGLTCQATAGAAMAALKNERRLCCTK